MKRFISLALTGIILTVLSSFIVRSFLQSSRPPVAAQPPVLLEAPARVYGTVEPAGREVFVSPPETKEVTKIYVKEGDIVTAGQTLCVLDNDVEMAELQAALASIESAKSALAISQDDMKRKKDLYRKNVDSEYKYTQARLKVDLEKSNLLVAQREAELARTHLEELELKSPIDGKVYKFDVRIGETLSSGDNTKIILGSTDLWVRLFIEAYWKDRIALGGQYKIYNSETDEQIGTGKVIYKAPYMGRRNFRTEDVQERFDTKFQEIVLSLTTDKENIPIGLSVVSVLSQE